MACVTKYGLHMPGSSSVVADRTKESEILPSFSSFRYPNSQFLSQSSSALDQKTSSLGLLNLKSPHKFSVQAQASYCVSKAMRWWEKTLKPNMVEIHSAQELVDILKSAGERLVIIDFYSPGCGGCRTLHPKICQLAEANPDAVILKVNYEELKKMCHALHIHVLPFFRFYKGSKGRLCSFSCTVSTIKKFKDQLAKHSDGGGKTLPLGPAKGLDESELLALASIGEISLNSALVNTSTVDSEDGMKVAEKIEDLFMKSIQKSCNPSSLEAMAEEVNEDNPVLVV